MLLLSEVEEIEGTAPHYCAFAETVMHSICFIYGEEDFKFIHSILESYIDVAEKFIKSLQYYLESLESGNRQKIENAKKLLIKNYNPQLEFKHGISNTFTLVANFGDILTKNKDELMIYAMDNPYASKLKKEGRSVIEPTPPPVIPDNPNFSVTNNNFSGEKDFGDAQTFIENFSAAYENNYLKKLPSEIYNALKIIKTTPATENQFGKLNTNTANLYLKFQIENQKVTQLLLKTENYTAATNFSNFVMCVISALEPDTIRENLNFAKKIIEEILKSLQQFKDKFQACLSAKKENNESKLDALLKELEKVYNAKITLEFKNEVFVIHNDYGDIAAIMRCETPPLKVVILVTKKGYEQ